MSQLTEPVGVRRHYWVVGVVFTLVALALFNYHWQKLGITGGWHVVVNSIAFLSIISQLVMAHLNPEFEAEEDWHRKVCVVVPCYNEDPLTFRAMLDSMDAQTRKPDVVFVVDDGSQTLACSEAFGHWRAQSSIESYFHRQQNAGKREAQAVAFRAVDDADIYTTVDSDTVLDPLAIERGIKPLLADRSIQCVAGLLLGLNWNHNLLTRLVDVGFVTSFLSGRAAWSVMRSVAVLCGGLGFYRGVTVRKHLDEYLNQKVGGEPMTYGDDRVLTNLCLTDGGAVFQQSSVGYTLSPVNLKHLTKQRIRWWRSWFWGGEWLTRRLSMRKAVWWLVVGQMADFVVFTFVLTLVVPIALVVSPIQTGHLPWLMLAYLGGLGYLRNIRYLSLKRPDQTFRQQLGVYALSPLAVLLNSYLCTVLQYVGLMTLKTTGWSTRQKVEVGLDQPISD